MKRPGVAKLAAFWDTVRSSYWFVPTIMAVAAVALWVVVHVIELVFGKSLIRNLSWLYSGGPDGARELLGVVSSSMINVAGVTFSITIVALTLASQQFGPFLLRNFMRDKGNQVVLGTFIATFIFALLTLRIIGADGQAAVPHLSVSVAVLLAMFSLGVLIYFIHHVSAFIQASNIISVVSRDLSAAVDRLFPEKLGFEAEEDAQRMALHGKLLEDFEADAALVRASGYGYLKALDNDMLLKIAIELDIIVRMLVRPGDFIGEGDAIAQVRPDESYKQEVEEAINETLVLGDQRTVSQDVDFIFNQIVEVAVRSLSPGVNDPFTAIICIDHLGQGLRRLAGRAMPSPFRHAEDGTLRIIAYPLTFPEMADTALNQIRHYGRSSPAVLCRLLETVSAIAGQVSREEDRQALSRHCGLIMAAAAEGLQEKEDLAEVKQRYFATIRTLKSGGANDKSDC